MSIPSADHELHRGHTLAGPLSCKTLFIVNSELWTWSNQTGSRYHAQDDLMFLSALYLTCRWGNLQLWPESHMKAKSFLSEHIPGNLKGTLNLQQCNPEATHCTNNKCFLKDNLHWSSFLHFKHEGYNMLNFCLSQCSAGRGNWVTYSCICSQLCSVHRSQKPTLLLQTIHLLLTPLCNNATHHKKCKSGLCMSSWLVNEKSLNRKKQTISLYIVFCALKQ